MPVEIDVDHVAKLARLALTDEEKEELRAQLSVILEHAARVGEVAAENVKPTSYSIPRANVLRADDLRPSLSREDALANAPETEDNRFRVPRVAEID